MGPRQYFLTGVAVLSGVLAAGALKGCAIGECLETRQQVVSRQICETRSSTGFCTHWRTETSTQDVCVRRAKTKSSSGSSSGSRETAAESRKRYMELAKTHHPPRNFDSCVKMSGYWHAECTQQDGTKCVQASKTKGLCDKNVIPFAQSDQSCKAEKGEYSYGWCRGYLDPEDAVKLSLFELDGKTGAIKNPDILTPGVTRDALAKKLPTLVAYYPPKNLAACRKLEGGWQGLCTRKQAGKCTQVSSTQGQCTYYIDPKSIYSNDCNEKEDYYDGSRFTPRRWFSSACVGYAVKANGEKSCKKFARGYGVCKVKVPSPGIVLKEDLYYVKRDGSIDQTPRKPQPTR